MSYGPKTVQYSCCNLCDVWGGSVRKKMPSSFLTLTSGIDKWNSRLSNIKSTGPSLQDVSHAIKFFRQSKQTLSFGQTVEFAAPTEAVGAPVNTWFLRSTVGNISTTGTWLTMALTATIIVTFFPLSPDVTVSTCLIPSAQIILEVTQIVELAVSSKL